MSKILVVDDELNICELLKLYLENEGYTVFTANDGQAAVTAFQQKAPDLVLLDIDHGIHFDQLRAVLQGHKVGRLTADI